jgi:aminoglycoside phosphotransferase (APT) family kinase protein
MAESKEIKPLEQLVRRIDPQSKLLRTWQLKGGVSVQMTAIEMMLPDGNTNKLIVRRHDVNLRRNPHIAADEFKLLQLLRSEGVPTPTPDHLDQSGEIFSTPYLVLEYVEGMPEFAPSNFPNFILKFATTLARIHRADASKLDLSFLPQQEEMNVEKLRARPAHVDAFLDKGRIREALASIMPFPQANQVVLLHGDFWPGNLLWKDDQVVAVIDWEDAALGDPLADLGNSRLEILWAFGIDAMHSFTHHYQSIMTAVDYTDLPYWDLCAALRPASQFAEWAEGWQHFGRNDVTEKSMREGHQLFITQAFEKLSIRRRQ